jgi:hypothetical protein
VQDVVLPWQPARLEESLSRARVWELEVMAGRPAVIQRMLDLVAVSSVS